MKGLLIEDDPIKAEKILSFLKESFAEHNMIHRSSYKSALKVLFEDNFDFILLDMSLPTYDQKDGNFSGKPRNFGGRDILKEMKRYKKNSRVKVVTQYNDFDGGLMSIDELDTQLKKMYDNLYEGYVIYNYKKQSEWKSELTEFIEKL